MSGQNQAFDAWWANAFGLYDRTQLAHAAFEAGQQAACAASPQAGEKVDPTMRPISDSALKRFGHAQYKDGYAQGWHDRASAPQAALTDEQIMKLARTHLVAGDAGEVFGVIKFARALLTQGT